MVFAQLIAETARQFSIVKKVNICAVGDPLIDFQLEKPFAKCPKIVSPGNTNPNLATLIDRLKVLYRSQLFRSCSYTF